MLFNLSKYYCKYVISIINENVILGIKSKIDSKELDDKLYESYLKLEELLNSEISNM